VSAPPPTPAGAGTAAEIAPGVLRACMKLPGPLHVNCWLIADGDGWLLVDAGRGDAATRGWWQRVFATALGGRPGQRADDRPCCLPLTSQPWAYPAQ
jgi:hypothetical protein